MRKKRGRRREKWGGPKGKGEERRALKGEERRGEGEEGKFCSLES